ncbi:unnamed protein product [Candida verbasci]|uniref:DNA 3'-phosphatase n=1 Tax=Candida verbasci TaxID=1227364 RepID=A0A9W4X907_9ASCO|nr:unnamed protein product [Candida verbasci]
MSKDITSMIGKKISKPVKAATKSVIESDIIKKKLDTDILFNFDKHWSTKGTYLIKNIPKVIEFDSKLVKVAAFDLDGTLINTKSGNKFATSASDWKWFNEYVIPMLKKLQDYLIVIFTNQGGVVSKPDSKSYIKFIARLNLIAKELETEQIDIRHNLFVYASPKKPAKETTIHDYHAKMRKPNTGMWEELKSDLLGYEVDLEHSFFIGDAAGRKSDFSNSDLLFAKHIGIEFKTPEELFKDNIETSSDQNEAA